MSVILLKASIQDTPDPYEVLFKSFGYNVSFVPVLETISNNLEELKRILLDHRSTRSYGGVVITSARACESWKVAVDGLLSNASLTEVNGLYAIF
jgi:uroporphyrinogen-III synthase